jgi:hypothetical protein
LALRSRHEYTPGCVEAANAPGIASCRNDEFVYSGFFAFEVATDKPRALNVPVGLTPSSFRKAIANQIPGQFGPTEVWEYCLLRVKEYCPIQEQVIILAISRFLSPILQPFTIKVCFTRFKSYSAKIGAKHVSQ